MWLVGEILQGILETFLEWALRIAPKPVRIGCIALLVLVIIALLTIPLWVRWL
ncbi:hypothetical protein LZK98_12520 [Sphingomonas cannabina]|uniref:hypothetical protein n=1 Tax=Sphingomonas cannabina TaxID=2899123 RepID=UPI001F3FBBCB|nr:hypothetical protein [Sphingomonas cannabina]UIJ43914.1 hypothetical protein LZK98_12520 [Sphingomonas cannabina]